MKLITVKTFDSAMDAHLFKSKLESEGIICFLQDEHTSTNYLPIRAIGIRLDVMEVELEKTIEIVSKMDRAYVLDLLSCPKCNSLKVEEQVKIGSMILGIIASIFIGLIPVPAKDYDCMNCGSKFKR